MGLLSRLLRGAKGGAKKPRFSVVAHVAFEGAIRVLEAPLGEAWQYDEVEREGEGFIGMTLKYVLPASPTPLALMAKIYTIKPGFAPPPADSAATDWNEIFGPLFSEISNVQVQATHLTTMTGRALPAAEAILDGRGADSGAPLRIRERRAALNEEEFIVTAMGTPELFAAHAGDIDRWFSTAAFVPISDARTSPQAGPGIEANGS